MSTTSTSLSSSVTWREQNTTGSTPVREHRDSTKSSLPHPFKRFCHMVVVFSYTFSVVRIGTEPVQACYNASSRSVLHCRGGFPYFKISFFPCTCAAPNETCRQTSLKLKTPSVATTWSPLYKRPSQGEHDQVFEFFIPSFVLTPFVPLCPSPSLFSISNSVVS
jgi:hypothetical protein